MLQPLRTAIFMSKSQEEFDDLRNGLMLEIKIIFDKLNALKNDGKLHESGFEALKCFLFCLAEVYGEYRYILTYIDDDNLESGASKVHDDLLSYLRQFNDRFHKWVAGFDVNAP